MRKNWPAPLMGVLISSFVVGYLCEFSRSEQLRISALIAVWGIALVAYLIPSLWFITRGDQIKLAWLLPPVLGTILLHLIVVSIPNEFARWSWSNPSYLLGDLRSLYPAPINRFLFFVVFYSAISYFIMALTYLAFIGFRRLRPL